MRDNALRIFLFMYCVSWSIVGVDVTIAEPLGIDMTINGNDIGLETNKLLAQVNTIQAVDEMLEAQNVLTAERSLESAVRMLELYVYMVFDFLAVLFGLELFNLMLLIGIDKIWVDLIQSVYVILLAYSLLNYLPKVAKILTAITSTTGQVIRIFRP